MMGAQTQRSQKRSSCKNRKWSYSRMTSRKIGKGEDFLAGILSRAIELRGDEIEIEYKDGYEEIFAIHNCLGRGIGRIESDSEEARSLRQLLHKVEKKTWG